MGGANGLGQVVDIRLDPNKSLNDFNFVQFGSSTVIGGVAGGLGGTVQPYYGRTPSLGNSQSILAGARFGLRVQGNAAPATVITNVTQAHLDAVNAVINPPAPTPPAPLPPCPAGAVCPK